MGTTDNFDSPAVATFDLTDTLPVIDSVTTRAATATGAQVLSGLSGVVNTTATTLLVTRALHGNRTVTSQAALRLPSRFRRPRERVRVIASWSSWMRLVPPPRSRWRMQPMS